MHIVQVTGTRESRLLKFGKLQTDAGGRYKRTAKHKGYASDRESWCTEAVREVENV